jgi:hypothetical protein
MLMNEFRVELQVLAQAGCVAAVEEVDSAAKDRVFDALVVAEIEAVGGGWLLDAALQACPAGHAGFTGDGQLRIAQGERRCEDFGVRKTSEPGMELSKLLGGVE